MKAGVKLFVLLMFLLLGTRAAGQVYLGATYGISDNDAPEENLETGEPGLEGDVGFRVYLGNKLSEKFSVELAFIDLGEYDAGEFQFDTLLVEDIATIRGLDLSFVGKWPIRRKFSLFGRAGVFVWEAERPFVDIELVDGLPEPTLTLDKKVDDVDYSLGLGVDYQFMRHAGFTIEANRYQTSDLENFLFSAGFYLTF